MKRIYVELLFLDNFLLDFFLLCCCSRLSERCVRLSRVAAGAAIGGVYGMLAALLPPLRAIVCKLPAAAILCLPLGARPLRLYLRRVGFFLLAGFLLGGILFSLRCAYPTAGALPRRLFFAGLCLFCLLYELLLRQSYPQPQRAYTLCFSLYGRRFCLRAVLDTGNGLCDAGGGSVIVVRRNAVLPHLRPEEAETLLDPARSSLPMRSFACATVAGEAILPAFAPEDLTLRDGARVYRVKAYLALADLSPASPGEALLGQNLRLHPGAFATQKISHPIQGESL